MADLEGRWWVAHTKARFEKAVARDLASHDVGYFLPLVERVRISGGRKRRVRLPLFPSYVFICGDDEARAVAMRTNRLCQTIEVTDQDQLIAECSAIERALAGGAELDLCQGLAAGKRCQVTSGAFEGTEGVVVSRHGRTRIMLEVSTLGLGASLEVDADMLEPIN